MNRTSVLTSNFTFLLIALFSTTFWACPGDDNVVDPINDCWQQPNNQLVFDLLSGPTIELPSKVSVFFKLNDNDGNPVPRLTESDFTFFEEGTNDDCPTVVSISEADRKIKNSPQVFKYSTVLVLDLSGSVISTSLEQLKTAANQFVNVVMPDTLGSGFSMSVWWFDGEDNLNNLVQQTDNIETIKDGINSIDESISNDSSTDLFGAVIKSVTATEAVLAMSPDIISSASLVIFTDGRDRAQRYTREAALNAVDNSSSIITIFSIGLGSEINIDDLTSIGKDGFKQADSLDDLIGSFEEVGNLIVDEADSYYNFEYCSPIRSGMADLIIQANFSGKEGYIQVNYSGTNFEGGCEL